MLSAAARLQAGRGISAKAINTAEILRFVQNDRTVAASGGLIQVNSEMKDFDIFLVIGQLQGGVDAVRQNRGLPFSRTAATTEALSPIRFCRIPPVTEKL